MLLLTLFDQRKQKEVRVEYLQIVILALIQGITEFLPISSSAHLILPSALLGWPDQGLAFDVAVHVGSLAAVVIYFRHDIAKLVVGWFGQFGARGANEDSRLAWYIIVATVPACIAGLLLGDFIEEHLRSITVIASTTILFGIVLWLSDRGARHQLSITEMTLLAAVLIGCAQALALIPGTSRSGITITMALFLGFTRQDSARFSFLLSIPIITISGLYQGYKLLDTEETDWTAIVLGSVMSAIAAYLCIYYFLSFINRLGMLPFVIYRLVLGGVLVAVIALT